MICSNSEILPSWPRFRKRAKTKLSGLSVLNWFNSLHRTGPGKTRKAMKPVPLFVPASSQQLQRTHKHNLQCSVLAAQTRAPGRGGEGRERGVAHLFTEITGQSVAPKNLFKISAHIRTQKWSNFAQKKREKKTCSEQIQT